MNGEPDREGLWELRLYVCNHTLRSVRAFANLKRMCEEHLAGKYRIEVIDVMQQPQLAREAEIVAIPTVVRCSPLPVRRVIGDLRDTEKALHGLQLCGQSYG